MPNAIARRWSPCVVTVPSSGARRAADAHAVGQLLGVGADRAQIRDDGGDAVALLDAQLAAPVITRLAARRASRRRRAAAARRPSPERARAPIVVARSAPAATTTVGHRLTAARARDPPSLDARAHARAAASKKPLRVSLTQTSRRRARPRRRAPPARRRTRPTTDRPARVTSSGCDAVRPASSRTHVADRRRPPTPRAASMRSV